MAGRDSTTLQSEDTSRLRHTGDSHILNVAPFLNLAREVSTLIVPVPVRPAFRTELERSLLVAARQQAAQHRLDIQVPAVELAPQYRELAVGVVQPVTDRMDRRWLMGAAVGSAFSLAGLMAYVWRQRRRHVA